MSILHPDRAGVKPAEFDVRTPDQPDPCSVCGYIECRAESRWDETGRDPGDPIGPVAYLDGPPVEDIGCEEARDVRPVDRVDYAYICGWHLGYQMVPANPSRDYSDAEVEAWFGGYHDGRDAGIQDALDEIDRRDERLRILDEADPGRTWHESEVAAARSNGGHPGWEN